MARSLEGARRSAFIAEKRQFLVLCEWKTAADRVIRPFGDAIYTQGFANRNASRSRQERYIRNAYAQRDGVYKRAHLMARNHLLGRD